MTRMIDVYTPPLVDFVAWKAFEPEECDQIKKLGELFEFHKAKIGNGGEGDGKEDIDYRDTDITWIEPNDKTHWIFDRMNEIVAYLNFTHFQMDLECFDGFQYSKYKEGGHYKRHTDVTHTPMNGLYRKLSMTVMLTDPEEYEGGEFVLDIHGNPDEAFKVKPKKGEMILFYSHLPHMVMPVTKGKRISLVTWALGEKIR